MFSRSLPLRLIIFYGESVSIAIAGAEISLLQHLFAIMCNYLFGIIRVPALPSNASTASANEQIMASLPVFANSMAA